MKISRLAALAALTATSFAGQVSAEVALGRDDGSAFGCQEVTDLPKFRAAIEAEDGPVIMALVIDSDACVPIWSGSTGQLVQDAPPSDVVGAVLVEVTGFAKYPGLPARALWVYSDFMGGA